MVWTRLVEAEPPHAAVMLVTSQSRPQQAKPAR
jgi:hypothetical protein